MRDSRISFIVPTYGRAEGLKKLFESVRKFTPSDVYELVVVSSDPKNSEKAVWLSNQPNIRVIFADERKKWQLRRKSNYFYLNTAIKNSTYPWIFPVSDDMYFDSNWHEEFIKVINDPKNANAGLIIVAGHIGNVASGIRVDVIGKTKKGNGDWKDLYLSDISIVRRDVMESIGMFDEKMDWFGSGADLSLSVEFLSDTDTIIAENITINHSISKENRGGNMGNAFSDFHHILNKWNDWCKKHDSQYIWDPGLPPYTVINRIKNAIEHRKKILRYYKKYFLSMVSRNKSKLSV